MVPKPLALSVTTEDQALAGNMNFRKIYDRNTNKVWCYYCNKPYNTKEM